MISAGSYHTVGMKADGTAVACGMNFDKQCDLSGFKDLKMISAGQTHTLGLKQDGTVISAGSALMGQADVESWKNVVYISAGDCFSVGVTSVGEVLVCGKPVNTGSVENAQLLSSPASISAGNLCVAAIDKNGRLRVSGSGAPDISHLDDVEFIGKNFFIQ
jgi:alpha-tubulin suppressor-like RCC1 family protein